MNPFLHRVFILLALFFHFLFLCGAVGAQPDAGTLLQEQRQLLPTLPDRLPGEGPREEVKAPLADTGSKVIVKAFRFTGRYEGMASEAELLALVARHIGQELGFAELQQVAGRVTQYLREQKGFLLARAYLPRQDVTDGIVEIAILAGRLDGKVRIDLKEPSRISPSLLQGIADRAVPEGSPIRMERIERAVLLMNDLPGVNAQASLERGAVPGSTRLVVNAAEGPLVQGLLSGDNYGDRFTGDLRATGQLSLYDPSGRGDQFSLSLTGAERLFQGRAAYAIPLGASGWTWNAAYTGLDYRLGRELEDLDSRGSADTYATGLSYPLLRSRQASLWSGIGFEYLHLVDKANGDKIRDRKLPVGNLSLSGSFFDGFGGGGLTSANAVVTGGSLDLSGHEVNKANDERGPKTHGGFLRGAYSLARLQRLSRDRSLFGSLRGQFASGNLDSSQKFILGGPTGVRAYPVGEAAGDEGHVLTVETRYDLPLLPSWAATQLVAFFDGGWVKLHRSPWPGAVASATGKNDYWLSGGGLGLNVGKAGLYSLRFSYAHKIGPNDGKSAAGKDADNRSDDGRFWLQLLLWL
ncbi:MAG TPA: ShlB/FhaC/HecB family hemolysin secretion/activation protein [Smithellaceae bacterium]|nr:ShlB/FhaC/HecB family hemolysin secretion/activation protein [Smithellaceae bacterium]